MAVDESIYCPRCHQGHMHLRLVTYVWVYCDTLISAPNTPAWECDLCRAREYNQDALLRLTALVGERERPLAPRSAWRTSPSAAPVHSLGGQHKGSC